MVDTLVCLVMNPNCECASCKTPLYRRPSRLGKDVYCSRKCFGQSCKIIKHCVICGSEVLGKSRITCSTACSNKNRTGINYNQIGKELKSVVSKKSLVRRRLIDHLGFEHCQRCEYSKFPSVLHVHHVIERCKGGTDEVHNLELLCPTCHAEEHYSRKVVGV